MRIISIALIIGLQIGTATAHEGWFARICPARTEADRIYLQFADENRHGFTWSWSKGRSATERPLPDRFRSAYRLFVRGQTVPTANNVQPHACVCIGFRDHIVQRMEFDDHEDHEKYWYETDDCGC